MALILVLAAALGLALVAVAVLGRTLGKTRRELAAAQERLRTPEAPRALRVAGHAVRNVVDTVTQVRKHGVTGLLMSSIQDFTRWTTEDRAQIADAATPEGIVTIFFSDIEGSTQLNEQLGDAAWLRLLADHDRLVRAQVARFHGHVVKTQGDGFMIVFGDPLDGVRSAVAIQAVLAQGGGRRLRRTPVRVRIGMHVGVVTSRDGDYFGRNVALAARVAAHAEGGQTLVTDALRDALGDTDAVVLAPGDEVELRGLAGRHRLWIVRGPVTR